MINLLNRKTPWITLALCATVVAGLGLGITGCTEEEQPQVQLPPAPPPPPPVPEKPAVTPIEQLMVELNIDPKVKLPEELAPPTDEERRAVLSFFDTFARGNSTALKNMLPLAEQHDLNALVQSGAWKDTTSKIQQIGVQTGTNDIGQSCALAVIEVGQPMGISFQPQLWYYTVEEDTPTFEAAPTPPGIMDKLSGDWIAAWHAILAEELALANEAEVEITLAQRDLDNSEDGQNTMQGPTGGRGLRQPAGPPQAPPALPEPTGPK